MTALVLVGWPQGLATGHTYDFTPLGWALIALLVVWASGVRIPPWAIPVAASGALIATGLAQQLGVWMPPVGPVLAAAALAAFLVRVAPRWI
jgi:hypothetical protein